MRRFEKSMYGVTLLEIMLVLAVAAMIIVMSVRYYQSANASQQSNAILETVQAITAAADGLSQGTGTYNSATTANIAPMMPGGTMTTPWPGGTINITPGSATYSVSITGMPAAVCPQLRARLGGNPKITPGSCGTGTGSVTFGYTYNM